MHTGMLWFDNSTKRFEEKLKGAIAYYEKKHGRKPDLCFIHPSMVDGEHPKNVEGLTVRVYRPVLPGHIWIGIEDKE